jgi:hypothetical protein
VHGLNSFISVEMPFSSSNYPMPGTWRHRLSIDCSKRSTRKSLLKLDSQAEPASGVSMNRPPARTGQAA